MQPEPARPTALTDWAYATIKQAILSLEFPPGFQLPIDELAERMCTSRTPIREALLRMEREGLVRVVPRVGFFVTEISPRDLWELFELRRVLEGYAANRVARKLTDDDLSYLERLLQRSAEAVEAADAATFMQTEIQFHDFLVEHAQNRHLVAMMASIRDLTYRQRSLSFHTPEHLRVTLNEHLGILAALRRRDGTLAQKLMDEHLRAARRRVPLPTEESWDEEEGPVD